MEVSKQADRLLADLLDDREDGVTWDEAVYEIQRKCDVQANTAEQYIRRSENAVKQETVDGETKVVSPEYAGESVVHDDSIMEREVGEPTGDTLCGLPILKDEGHPEIPRQHETGYIRRRMGTNDNSALRSKTDVQIVASSMADPDFSTLLIGKHGVGKDRLILHICAKTNRPTIRLVANDDPDFVDLLIGTYAPDEDGNFTRKKGLLQIAIENGYTFIMDEFNTLSGKVQTMLNKILEDSGKSQLVIPETNQVIEPHEQFRFVATQNPNEVGYGGREDLDQATGSRFYPIELPALQESGERQVVAAESSWDSHGWELDTILGDGGVVPGIRSLHDMGKVSTWVSTRDVIQIARMAEQLGDVEAATELVLVGRAAPEDKEPIRSKISDTRWR